MAGNVYDAQWKSIMSNSMFSEPAVITDEETFCLDVTGVYCSGSYSEESPAAYAPKARVNKDSFQLSADEITEEIDDPEKSLVGMKLLLPNRPWIRAFRIFAVDGNNSGLFTLNLQKVKEEG